MKNRIETESGHYSVNNGVVYVNNSGYRQRFSIQDLKQGMKTGRFISAAELKACKRDGLTDEEILDAGWSVKSDGNTIIVETIDEMHIINKSDIK